jgi:hypothetical protein
MSFYAESSRLAWLMAALGGHRDRIAGLLCRLRGIGAREAMNPSLFKKFLHMLDQVAFAREKEVRILNQIEAIEEKHRFRREHHQLESAADEPKETLQLEEAEKSMAEHPRQKLLWLLAFWHLFMRNAINQKKQGLTAD